MKPFAMAYDRGSLKRFIRSAGIFCIIGNSHAINAMFLVDFAAQYRQQTLKCCRTMSQMRDQPFSLLTPDSVLDALGSVGLRGDGRLLALNSYENRVYQVGMEDGPPLIAKFYRPARWSDAQILEEHAFVAALAEREIPAVPALEINGQTLQLFNGFRF
jgi:hypothetical protein